MKIKDWEDYVIKKYGAIKIENFIQLKQYLTSPRSYAHNFTPEEITELEIMNDEYYSTYVFDESKMVDRPVKKEFESGWNKLIIVLASDDEENISNYSINVAGRLTEKEYDVFYKDINPLKDEKTLS